MNPEMKQTWKQLKRKSEVIFTGHLSQDRLAALMSAAHAMVFIPYFEGFGLPVIESFASGVPVLAANTSALPEIAGDAALLVDPFNTDEIAAGMERIAGDTALRNKLINAGMAQLAKFDWDASEEIIWKQIDELAKKF
jgi:glycosyltransferase involved in cell wall biosynthesis